MLTFEWYGQACFKVENSITIVTDPHDGESIGLKPPPEKVADLVTISHRNHDHAIGEDIVAREDAKIIKDSGTYTEKGVTIKGIESFHDKVQGSKRGKNIIFVFEVDGIKVCHLGDLGHQPAEEDIEEIGPVDVLLVPVGGNYTIDGVEAADLTKQLDPRIVIPIHFLVEGLTVELAGLEEFANEIRTGYEIIEEDVLRLDSLPDKKLAVRLQCLAN